MLSALGARLKTKPQMGSLEAIAPDFVLFKQPVGRELFSRLPVRRGFRPVLLLSPSPRENKLGPLCLPPTPTFATAIYRLYRHLEQEKHELRRRFENREGEWEGRVSELESDVKQLQDELEKQQVHLREADREKTRAVQELSEQNQRLLDQLSRASEVERQLSLQVHTLREDFREKSSSSSQHIVRLESLQAEQVLEIKMLTDRKRELERRLSAMMEENDLLQGTVEELQDRVLVLERQSHDKDLQLHQSQLELQEVRLSYRQLQGKVEELSEERSLQNFNTTSTSLLSEIEQSMEAEELEQEREQLRLQLWEAYCQVRYLCSHLRGNDSADSAVSTDSSMDESSETSSAKDVPAGSLRAALSELKRLIQNVLDGADSTSSRRSDDDTLEEQIRRTSEDSRALRELMEGERGKLRQSLEELQRLHSQVTLLSVEMTTLKEERDRLRGAAEDKDTNERLLQAIRDRDEAIAKKNAVEVELAKCKIDMMSLNSQLLDAIQQKVNLSQQLEAWQVSGARRRRSARPRAGGGTLGCCSPRQACSPRAWRRESLLLRGSQEHNGAPGGYSKAASRSHPFRF
nr:PREDICTED: bicaudal D-related protein 1 [Struthio camelus australis]